MTSTIQSDTFFSVSEVATRVRVAPLTIFRLIRADAIHAIRIGKEWRVSARELHRVMRDGVSYPPRTERKPHTAKAK